MFKNSKKFVLLVTTLITVTAMIAACGGATTEAPATEPPATEAPATQAPATEAPAIFVIGEE